MVCRAGVGKVFDSADDVGHAHVVVVDDHREHVRRCAIRPEQDEVLKVLVGDRHSTQYLVIDDRLAFGRRLDADNRVYARRRFGWIAVAPAPIVAGETACRLRLGAHRVQLFGCVIGVIRFSCRDELLGHLAVARSAGKLEQRLALPLKPQPVQAHR